MSEKLPVVKPKEVVKALLKAGFVKSILKQSGITLKAFIKFL